MNRAQAGLPALIAAGLLAIGHAPGAAASSNTRGVELAAGTDRFEVQYTPHAHGDGARAAIIFSALGRHALDPERAVPVVRALADAGWQTVSIAISGERLEASRFLESHARMEPRLKAIQDFLVAREVRAVALIGFGAGAGHAELYAGALEAKPTALVLVNPVLPGRAGEPPAVRERLSALPRQLLEVLTPKARLVTRRLSGIRDAEVRRTRRPGYRLLHLPGVDGGELVARRIRGWLVTLGAKKPA